MENRLKQVARASLEPWGRVSTLSASGDAGENASVVQFADSDSSPIDVLTSLHGLLESTCPTLEMQQQAVQMLRDGTSLLSDGGDFIELPLPLFPCRVAAVSLVPQSHRQSAAAVASLRAALLTTLSDGKELLIDEPANTTSKGLFYDPFANNRVRSKDDAIQHNCQIWCVDSLCTVSVSLNNPLSTPLFYSNIQPVFEGDNAENMQLFEQPILIPANSVSFVIHLRVKPRKRGNIQIAGLRLCIGKAERVIYVDENGIFK